MGRCPTPRQGRGADAPRRTENGEQNALTGDGLSDGRLIETDRKDE